MRRMFRLQGLRACFKQANIVFHGALKPALKNKQTEATKFFHFVPKRTNKRIPCQKYLTFKFVSPVCQRKVEDGLKRCWISCLAFVSRQKSDEPILDNSQVNSDQGILVKKAKWNV